MRYWFRPLFLLSLMTLGVSSGCGRVVFQPSGAEAQAVALSPQQQQTIALQQQQLQQRADALDKDNQELESLLAQSRQQMQLMRDQVVATQEQLQATADRLAAVQQERNDLTNRTQALTASMQRPGGAEIWSNNTLLQPLQLANLGGVEARQDGDTIRVTIRGDELFQPGSVQVRRGAEQLIQQVGTELLATYPEQRIGIEGHVDPSASGSAQYPTPHHLSVAQATVVYELLRRTVGAAPNQLFLIGHGANHPLVSNATPSGQAQNRRIEIVVYPETTRQRP